VGAVHEMEYDAWMMAQSRLLSMNGSAEGTARRCSRGLIAGRHITSSGQDPETLFWISLLALAIERPF